MDGLVAGASIPASLPARGNAVEATEGHEQKGFLTAIAVFFRAAIIADVSDRGIFERVAVFDLVTDPIVKLFGFEVGIGLVTSDLFGKLAQLRREDNVRGFFDERF